MPYEMLDLSVEWFAFLYVVTGGDFLNNVQKSSLHFKENLLSEYGVNSLKPMQI